MLRKARAGNNGERGALLVEYAMVTLALIGLLGGIIDLGTGLHYWSILTHYTINTTQIEAKHCTDCGLSIAQSAKAALEKELDGQFGRSGPAVVNVETRGGSAFLPSTLRLNATVNYRCFWCLFMGDLRLNASCQATIEKD